METIKLTTGDFLLNAGVVGFLRLWRFIRNGQGDYSVVIPGTTEIPVAALPSPEDLAEAIIDLYNKEYSADSKVQKAFNALDRLVKRLDEGKRLDGGEGDADVVDFQALKESLELIGTALTAASMKSGVEGIASQIEGVEFYNDFAKRKFHIPKPKEDQAAAGHELKSRLRELQRFCSQPLVRQTFLFKSVAYNVINRFWSDKCFLLPAKAKGNIKSLIVNDFTRPFCEYVKAEAPAAKPGKKAKAPKVAINCIACSAPVAKMADATAISFMIDVADDLNRKTSTFWNHNSDAYLCPVCALLYSLAPLGFRQISGGDFVFINMNSSIRELWNQNGGKDDSDAPKSSEIPDDVDAEEGIADPNSYSARVDAALLQMFKEKEELLSNVQVILRTRQENSDGATYQFSVYDRNLLTLIHRTQMNNGQKKSWTIQKNLQFLSKLKPFKMSNGNYFNVYRRCLDNVLNYRNQYNLLQMLILESLKTPWVRVFLDGVFNVQCLQTYSLLKEQEKRTMTDKKESVADKLSGWQYFAAEAGRQMRSWLLADAVGAENVRNLTPDKQEDIVRKVVYPLTNALKTTNVELFTDLLIRLYTSSKESIPSVFLQALRDENAFAVIGYAYVLGLKGALNFKDKDNKSAAGAENN